jgi:hypothetical protein
MTDKNSQTNKLAVALILSKKNDHPPLDCLMPEEMTLFNQRKLNRKRSQEVFAHLNDCSDCYMRWLECPPMKQKFKWDFWKNIPQINWYLPEFQFAPARLVPALAVVLILIAVFFWPNGSDKNFQYYLKNPDFVISSIHQHVSLPWETPKTHQNFANKKILKHQKVFATGMWTARYELFPIHDLPECPDYLWVDHNQFSAQLKPYYDLGRWCLFTQVACMKNVDAETFWKHQPLIAKNLINVFSDTDDLIIQKQLSESYDVLLDLDANSPTEKICYRLMKKIHPIIWHELR